MEGGATISALFTLFTSFATSVWTSIGNMINSIMGNEIVAMFVLLIPVFSLVVGLVMMFTERRG